ncbi:MAG: P-type conjugative transfer ATPase TrbB [Opitutaceae bacterium]
MESTEKQERVREKLLRELGPNIRAALADPRVIEVVLNPDGKLWVERLGEEMQTVGDMAASNAESLMATIASSLSTTITRERPVLEGELPTDGSRFEGMIPPVVVRPSFAIRKKASRVFSLEEYVGNGIMTEAQRLAIVEAVKSRRNILVVGGTGTGKTTLLNAIILVISEVSPEHRVVIIEDTVELQCSSKNVVQLRTSDTVTMQGLLRVTMRLRPDRILVGEVRGAEALALLKAWNTGHPGGLATVHANDASAGLLRIKQLVEEGLRGGKADPEVIAEAVVLVVVIKKTSVAPGRRVTEMVRVLGYKNGEYVLADDFSAALTPTPTKNDH